jgi:TonB family protein
MINELNSLAQTLTQTAQTLTQNWLAFSVVLAVQIALVLLLRKPVRAWLGAVACYRLWLLPLLCLPFYLAGPTLMQKLATMDSVTAQADSQTVSDLQLFIDFELLPFDVGATGTQLSASGNPAVNGWLVLALVWGIGTLALLAWQGRRWLDFSRQVQMLASPLDGVERKHYGVAAHFSSRVLALSLQGLGGAALFGIFKPALLLPDSFCRRYDGNQRHIILAHEAVHLRRRDNGWNVCAMLLMALFWTNPLVLLAWRYFRLDQELSCDALALTRCTPEQRQRYARTLLDSLGSSSTHTTHPLLSAWDNLGDIKERSLMVKQHLHTATRPVAMLSTHFALTMLGAALTVTFAELVSPVAQAAEPTPPTPLTQEVRQVAQAPRPVSQETATAAQVPAPATQQAPQATQTLTPTPGVQETRQVALEAEQIAQDARQVALEAEQVAQESRQVALEVRQVAQASEQVAQEVRQVAQASEQVAQEVRQAAQEAQQVAQESRQVALEAQRVAQRAQQVTQQPQRTSELIPGESRERPPEDEPTQGASTVDEQTSLILSEAIEFLNAGKFAESRESVERLRLDRLSPFERNRVHQLLFNLEMNDEDFPGAREQLQLAIDSGGLNEREMSMLGYQLAQLYVQEKKYAEAAAALEAWIAAEPMPNAAAYYLLGVSRYYLNQIDQALPNAEKAVVLGKSANMHVEAHYALLAALYDKAGQSAAAESVKAGMAELFSTQETARKQQALVPLNRVNPNYPRRALARGIEGWVELQFTIDETGAVIDPVVVASSPQDVFDNATINAVSRWRYNPKIEDGVATERAGVRTKVRFLLASE